MKKILLIAFFRMIAEFTFIIKLIKKEYIVRSMQMNCFCGRKKCITYFETNKCFIKLTFDTLNLALVQLRMSNQT